MFSDRRAFLTGTATAAGILILGCSRSSPPSLAASSEDKPGAKADDEADDEKEYEELGDQFEDKETQALGDHGFEHAVDDVAKLEQAFGLDDLAKLTPAP